ncbi:MAG: response regulator [Sulfuricaulis sp.]
MSKVNILVVDDHYEKLLVYQTVLAELDANVVIANSGEEALKLMFQSEFAVILLDVNMPVMDGFETARLIRGRKKLAHMPIIFVTAFGDEMHSAQGYALGAVDYIQTPIVPEVLRTKVKVFVQLFRMTEKIKQQAEDRVQLIREQAALAAAEAAMRRSTFLAEISHVLSRSLEFEETGKGLTQFLVPYLADFCALVTVDDSGQVQNTKLAWMASKDDGSIQQMAVVKKFIENDLQDAVEKSLLTRTQDVIRRKPGRSTLEVDDGGPDTRYCLQLGFPLELISVFPLFARGRMLGVLLLGFPESRPFGPTEQALASELASRASIVLDNALLFSKIRDNDQRKDEFLAMLAHELRNPLAPIHNAVQIMRILDSPGPTYDEAREIIAREVSHLTRLVDDLLDVSRITRGKINLKFDPLEVKTVLTRALESQRPLLESHRQSLEVTLPETPLWVQGDAVRLTQIIVNLLDNAVKFTPDGGRICVVAKHLANQCELKVKDNGIGISSVLLPEIFNLFTQGERSLDRRQGGLGIGLALVKDLVIQHGGSIQAFSGGHGKGSEFVIRLPILENVPLAILPAAVDRQPYAAPQRILIVDDHVESATSLATLLRMYGHKVETAYSGPDALQIVTRFRPRLAVLDIGLPDMNGYELAAKLLKLPATKNTILVAMTGYGQIEDRRRAVAAGFHHHLVKPVETTRLKAIIETLGTAGAT